MRTRYHKVIVILANRRTAVYIKIHNLVPCLYKVPNYDHDFLEV
jgi:hypothetical protein